MHIPKDVVDQPLYVVACIFNPVRFKSRYALYRDFQKQVRDAGAILITVEAACGERAFALEDHAPPSDPQHHGSHQSFGPASVPPSARMPHARRSQDYIKVRVNLDHQEIWLKENMLNIGVQHLPADAKYVAFIDADVHFVRPDWVSETRHALQHYDVVQMFSTAIDMSPTYEPLMVHRGFGYCHVNAVTNPQADDVEAYYGYSAQSGFAKMNLFHPGFAWAWRKSALDQVGGLIDRAILGAADHHMAWALLGRGRQSLPSGLTKGYYDMVDQWRDNAAALKHNVGYVPGTIWHRWHGRKAARKYRERWQILMDHGYDPSRDVKADSRGLLSLTGSKPRLRDGIRRYFRGRNEDCVYVPDSDHNVVPPLS